MKRRAQKKPNPPLYKMVLVPEVFFRSILRQRSHTVESMDNGRRYTLTVGGSLLGFAFDDGRFLLNPDYQEKSAPGLPFALPPS